MSQARSTQDLRSLREGALVVATAFSFALFTPSTLEAQSSHGSSRRPATSAPATETPPAAPATSATSSTSATSNMTAHELFDRGSAAYASGNYELSVELWTQAYALDARPRIQYNLAQAYERLGRLEDAIASVERYLETAVPNDPQYADANARLASMRQRLSLTGIVLHASREGGAIRIDDANWGNTPRPDRIPVSPGPHRVTIRWANGDTFVSNVVVPAGQSVDVAVEGTDLFTSSAAGVVEGGTAPTPEPARARTRDDGQRRKRRLFFSLGGASAAVGVGALAWALERNSVLSGCSDPGYACTNEDPVKRERTLGFVGTGVFLAGAAALFTIGALAKPDAPHAVSLSCGVGYARLACSGSF